MSRNKVIREQICGPEKQISKHERKIAALSQPYPNRRNLAKGRDGIARLRREITRKEATRR